MTIVCKNMGAMKYIVHVEHCNGKATNPCGHIYIKLNSSLPRQVVGKILNHTSCKIVLCLCRILPCDG